MILTQLVVLSNILQYGKTEAASQTGNVLGQIIYNFKGLECSVIDGPPAKIVINN